MRYLLVDRITGWEAGKEITGVKNVAMSEDFLEFHFPKTPVMPGIMLLEAMTQLAGWLEAAGSGFENWLLLTRVRKCNFYGFVLPGDQVRLEVRCAQAGANPAGAGRRIYTGIGEVDGRKRIKTEFEGEIVSLGDIEDPEEQKRFFRILTRELTI
jgi:3-hydroxyacyl-[acyl-carrier-protein] dehydratase